MKNEQLHNDQLRNDEDFLRSLPELEPSYSRSKHDVWQKLEAAMEASPSERVQPVAMPAKVRTLRPVLMTAAALLVVLLATTAFFRLYTKTVSAPMGQHLTALLPDGSSIELNAGSVVKYQPLWWRFNREVQFEGEGFFKVQKGQSFEVVSSLGRTIVLGTSFNIYARKNEYKVTCYTGKVRVVSVLSGQSTDITPNMQAYIQSNGSVVSAVEEDAETNISWMNDMFFFTGTPVQIVFEEVERQYGVRIQTVGQLNDLYSGNFSRGRSADEVMNMICLSMGLKLEKTSYGYKVSQ
ncbi:FecR family protein [Carboxylicivirga mesophila]|uniref:FecR family protein n=1 Tax=Carboxylicivirga mesophila TaxID=1166478 RepID=A0ABS5KC16_9BACT|nr:FecR family protein [Carboxylicivirga mesophila]MBS2212494.1 FecR family protein [Carboxylicivirga mesophila]